MTLREDLDFTLVDQLGVYVDLRNDDGEHQTLLAFGSTVDEAVADAERRAGGTYVMDDWRAA